MNEAELLAKQTGIIQKLGIVQSVLMAEAVMATSKEVGWTKDQLIVFLKMFVEQGETYQQLIKRKEHSLVE